MKLFVFALFLSLTSVYNTWAQTYKPILEPYPGLVKADPRLIVKTGYLVVPENRKQPRGRKIKVPFIYVRKPNQDAKKQISLFTTGGPGYSTTANIDSIAFDSGLLRYGGFIAFDQRGTKRALPCLDCMEVGEAVKKSYRAGLNKDSLVLKATEACRTRLVNQGIDLSAYTTLESAEDINDLRLALQVDSLNLIGMSYSGGLMLSVASRHPEAVRTLILNSPLPGFVNFEEHALLNLNEAFDQVFDNCEADSTGKTNYQDLRNRFHHYFSAITGKKFNVSYFEKGTHDSITVRYTKTELLNALSNRLNSSQVKNLPKIMVDIMEGKHAGYVREVLDSYFGGDQALALGMRYSVYCSEQISYANEELEKQQDQILPWLAGYPVNNVSHKICDCWNIKPEDEIAKMPVYLGVPALISAGDIDPACRPFYSRLIKRYLPNSQLLMIHNRGHLPGFTVDGTDYVKLFMEQPLRKLKAQSENLVVE